MTALDGLPDLIFVLQFRRTASTVHAVHEDAAAGDADTSGESSQPIHEKPAFASGLAVTDTHQQRRPERECHAGPGGRRGDGNSTQARAVRQDVSRERHDHVREDDASSELSFDTIGEGTVLGPVSGGKFTHGVVNWRITRGTGQFEGASGTISSSYLFDPQDALVDNHLALVWLP